MTERTWSPQRRLVWLGWALALAGLAWAVVTDDAPGRMLASVTALALGLLALHGTVARPRLAATERGLAVRGLGGTRRWTWPQVTIRVVHTKRLGRDTAMLELDGPDEDGVERLVVLSRLDLAADPEDVAGQLRALRP